MDPSQSQSDVQHSIGWMSSSYKPQCPPRNSSPSRSFGLQLSNATPASRHTPCSAVAAAVLHKPMAQPLRAVEGLVTGSLDLLVDSPSPSSSLSDQSPTLVPTSFMDQSSYQAHHLPRQQQQQLYGNVLNPPGNTPLTLHHVAGQNLPPPSQLHLPTFTRSNTLPPIPNMPDSRYPPASYHPSLSNATGPSPSPSAANYPPWPTHRTSSSREEMQPARRRDIKGKEVDHDLHDRAHPQLDHHKDTTEDGMPSTSDFVKKLYKMLEDSSFSHVVSWNQTGDAFVVKDMNEFTKSILPRMFKHSNFASFVRQLNKYDFHKVKNSDDNQFGEHSWTFRHPDFQADRRDALENIKRKVPAQRKSTSMAVPRMSAGSPGASPPDSADSGAVQALQIQVDRLTQSQDEMTAHMRQMENNYQSVLNEMINFQRTMAQQDGLMQNLIQYFLQLENAKVKEEPHSSTFAPDSNPFVPATEAQRMVGQYPEQDVARASLEQLNEISRRANAAGMTFTNGSGSTNSMMSGPSASRVMAAAASMAQGQSQTQGMTPTFGQGQSSPMSREGALQRISEELARNRAASASQQQQQQRVSTRDKQAQQAASSSSQSQQQQDAYANDSDQVVMPSDNSALEAYGTNANMTHSGLQVFTLGHLMPKSTGDEDSAIWSFDPSQLNMVPNGSQNGSQTQSQMNYTLPGPSASSSSTSVDTVGFDGSIERPSSVQKLRVRRSTFVPGWAVPPRVLLVEDDVVSRTLSSKFLQVFGCTIDVAVDGLVAVNKMNLEKYDLVLMDIVMPKLDGVSATTMIRQFDHMTPIISMTSNSKPTDLMTYYHHGMNDILPKPFTKEGLLSMLEKHLTHLKVIQEMSKIPRSVGIPPLSDSSFDEALMVTASNPLPRSDDEGKINPLAGMGLSDEDYAAILQNIVNGDTFSSFNGNVLEKRSIDESSDGRDAKRSRFEVLE